VVGEEAAAVLACEDAREPPLRVGQDSHVQDVHHQQVAGFGTLYADGPAEIVHLREVDDLDVVRRIVIGDLTAGPVHALDPKLIAGLHPGHHGNVGVPAVVQHVLLRGRGGDVYGDQCFHADVSSELMCSSSNG
jgi:hypothetical protein